MYVLDNTYYFIFADDMLLKQLELPDTITYQID